MGEPTRAPTWPIQDCTPCPTPTLTRPGNNRCIVAISIAVRATFRNGTGSSPMPTRSRSVHARAADAEAMPPSKKQSSHRLSKPGSYFAH